MASEKNKKLNTLKEIVEDFIKNDDLRNIKNSLEEMYFKWVTSDFADCQEARIQVSYHFECMRDLLINLEKREKDIFISATEQTN